MIDSIKQFMARSRALRYALAAAALVQASAAHAQFQRTPEPAIEPLAWVDSGYLTRQRALVDDITREEYGRALRGDASDLELLQRIVDDELIKPMEVQKLQALGVVLGDVYVKDYPFEWKTYSDGQGKSRAVCLTSVSECIFPVTLIAKRASRGLPVDVQDLYNKTLAHLQPFLPRLPYSARP